MSLINSTVAGNIACGSGAGCTGQGGGIEVYSGTTGLSNTILAGNSGATSSPDCFAFFRASLADGSPKGTVGDNLVGVGSYVDGNTTSSCGFTNGVNNDQVGTSAAPLDPGLDPKGLQSNGGPTQTIALTSTSHAVGRGDRTLCGLATISNGYGGSAPGPGNVDERGYPRRADSRSTCDIGAYDTGGPVTISTGWNLIGIPVQSPGTTTASGVLSSLNASSALGSNAATMLATYTNGRYQVYVPGYAADRSLLLSQGIFLLSSNSGKWQPPGSAAYPSGQPVNLQGGWNLVAATVPYAGLTGDGMTGEIGQAGPRGCNLQEVATYGSGGYRVYTPSMGPAGSAFNIPNTQGMFILCGNPYTWTPG